MEGGVTNVRSALPCGDSKDNLPGKASGEAAEETAVRWEEDEDEAAGRQEYTVVHISKRSGLRCNSGRNNMS